MLEKEDAKQNNKNMLKASLIAGGFALFCLTAFTFVTIGGSYISENNSKKEDADYQYKKDAEIFIRGLRYIANKEYQKQINVSTVSNYVSSISSIEYKNDGVYYCAVAQMHDKESSLIKVNISYNSDSIDSCISKINADYMKYEDLTISSTLYKEELNEEAKKNISGTFASKLEGFSNDNPFNYNVYEAKVIFAASLTYKSTDDTYCSIVSLEPLSTNEVFKIKYDTNKTMYYVLETLVGNNK
ncbi:MAG: hypothetical protein K6E21_05915 [Bacilli bacterium]|nr:hypothetical protein [Bacilli bacterium]